MPQPITRTLPVRDLPLILTALLLALAPLHRTFEVSLLPIGRELWNFSELIVATVLIIFFVFSIFFPGLRPRKKSVQVSIALSVALLIVTVLPSEYGILPGEFVRLLLIIWSIPLLTSGFKNLSFAETGVILLSLITLHAMWGIGQFIVQHDLGLTLIGESRLDPTIPGVAKFSTVTGAKVIRAYGPYFHANSLSGVLTLGFSILLVLQQSVPKRWLAGWHLFPFTVALLQTFSRSAWLGSVIALLVVGISPEVRLRMYKFHLDKLVIVLLTALVFMPLIADRMHDREDQAVGERLGGVESAKTLVTQNSLFGLGLGHYETALQDYVHTNEIAIQPWELAPVHSVPVLALVEGGVIGFIVVGAVLSITLYRSFKNRAALLWLLPLIPLLLFDHYWLTQTAPLLWLIAYIILLTALPRPVLAEE